METHEIHKLWVKLAVRKKHNLTYCLLSVSDYTTDSGLNGRNREVTGQYVSNFYVKQGICHLM